MEKTKKPLTLGEFSKNPSRSRTIPAAAITSIKAMYAINFGILKQTYPEIETYKDETKDGTIYFYIKMPSTNIKDFFYDVVIKLIPSPELAGKAKYDDYYIQVFSNDPAFAYTYAYAYNKENLIVSELVNKFTGDFLETKPEKTNPKLDINYSKIIYFGLILLKSKGALDRNLFGKIKLKEFSHKQLNELVMDVSRKIALRIKAGEDNKRKVKQDKKTKSKSTAKRLSGGRKTSSFVSLVKTAKRTMTTRTTKRR